DDQHLGLPGGRLVDPTIGVNQLVTDRRGAATPFDFADKQGRNVTAGTTYMLMPGAELIIDGGVRQKDQKASFFGTFFDPASNDPRSRFEATLTSWSFTPRIKLDHEMFGATWKAIGGIDYYNADYDSDRGLATGLAPIHHYDLNQKSLAAYWQQTVVLPTRT